MEIVHMKTCDKITRLANEWQNLIGNDHHKDRDCHFSISKIWSYGQSPTFRVEHFGYIWDSFSKEFKTQDEAEEFLLDKLTQMVEFEKHNV